MALKVQVQRGSRFLTAASSYVEKLFRLDLEQEEDKVGRDQKKLTLSFIHVHSGISIHSNTKRLNSKM